MVWSARSGGVVGGVNGDVVGGGVVGVVVVCRRVGDMDGVLIGDGGAEVVDVVGVDKDSLPGVKKKLDA